jgi:ATP-binding protein involved in chromosome partitioning
MSAFPEKLEKVGDEKFRIRWDDGHVSEYPFRYLRQQCRCAACRDEFTGAPLLDPESVPADLKASKATLVGNYAAAFQFSDGHGSGIYTFEALRTLCPCCKK